MKWDEMRWNDRKDEWMHARMHAWVNERLSEWMKERINEWMTFTREVTRSRTVTLLYCSHTRTALANYVVDMMTKVPLDIRP